MILDTIENLYLYKSINPNLENGLTKFQKTEVDYDNKVQFEGGYLFFQQGTTKPIDEGTFEAHKKYMDVQIVLEGSEYVAWADVEELEVDVAYNPEKDVERLNGDVQTMMKVSEGMAYICLPHDGHKALKHIDEPTEFVKAVIKVEM